MVEGLQIGGERKRRVGTCAWCGKKGVPRQYTVYHRGGQLYTAEVCGRCLEEYKRKVRWEGNHEGMATDA